MPASGAEAEGRRRGHAADQREGGEEHGEAGHLGEDGDGGGRGALGREAAHEVGQAEREPGPEGQQQRHVTSSSVRSMHQ